jgi:hypothetical protein
MFYVRLRERQENNTGRTPSKPHLFIYRNVGGFQSKLLLYLFLPSRNKNQNKINFNLFDSMNYSLYGINYRTPVIFFFF